MGEPFAELYAEHRRAALRLALALVPAGAAEDITEEAFTRVLTAQARGGGPTGAFRPYLLAAVRNLARDYNERSRREVPLSADPRRVTGPAELLSRREEQVMMARAFGSLPARHRRVLWQTEVEGRRPAELARANGMTANAVAQLAFRARAGLARAWQRERGNQERDTGPLPVLRLLADKKKPS